MITRDSIEQSYCFFHQKMRIYQHSSLEWQKDDIEYAVEQYVDEMNKELYGLLSCDEDDFLRCHCYFIDHMHNAIKKLEKMMREIK